MCIFEIDTVPSVLDTDRTQGWNAQSVITRGFEKFIMQSGKPGHVQPLNTVEEERAAPESFALVSSLPQAVLDKGVPFLWQVEISVRGSSSCCECNVLVDYGLEVLDNIDINFIVCIADAGSSPRHG